MLFAFTSVLHLQGILTGTVGNSWSQVERPGEACGLSTGQEGTVTHCSGQANCVDSSNQGTNTAVLWLIFNNVIFFHQHITYFHFDISNMVWLQMVISEMPGHQNNLACASVSYRVFLFTSFFSVFYRLKSYIAFEAKNRVIYKRILTLTPSVHRMSCHLTGKVTFSGLISYHVLHHNLRSKYKCLSLSTLDLARTSFPYLWGAEKPYVCDSLPSSFWCPSFNSPALFDCYLSEYLTHRTAITHWRYKLFSTALSTITVKTE